MSHVHVKDLLNKTTGSPAVVFTLSTGSRLIIRKNKYRIFSIKRRVPENTPGLQGGVENRPLRYLFNLFMYISQVHFCQE